MAIIFRKKEILSSAAAFEDGGVGEDRFLKQF